MTRGCIGSRPRLRRHYLPNRICASRDPADAETDHPLLKGKDLVNGKAALYVCRNFACLRPVTDPAEIEAVLRPPVSGHQAEQHAISE